mmetsp:Transcript_25978/g.61307  ORF Transcript_25978/g.61307 Transcript_25978/m.61307 type:complete len:298 (+) Transcript_25978:24-917(+)
METLTVDSQVEATLTKLRAQMFERGARGLGGVSRAFKICDFNGNKKLDREEFEEAMQFAGLFLSTAETSALFSKFDKDGDGNISYDEFLAGLRGGLSERRKAMVARCFSVMDRDGSGAVTVGDLAGIYNTSKHPDVMAGKITEEQALERFLEGFEGKGTTDARITMEEFENYYSDLGASVPSDEYFIEMMESVWMIPEKEGKAEAELVARYEVILREKVRQKCRPTESEDQKLRSVFAFFDTGEEGSVTIDEFAGACERLGLPLQRKEVRAFFTIYDRDASGTISYEEFVAHLFNDS